MKKNTEIQSQGFAALIPLLIFFIIYLGTGFICSQLEMEKPFSQLPTSVASFLALFLAFLIVKGRAADKFEWMLKGIAKPGVIIPVVICILLGGFSTIAKACGGVDSIVGICITYVPIRIITAAFFVTASIISFASSSSMLSIVATAPVALTVAVEANISIPVMVAAIMGAAVFGNTLNPISDCTTVANSAVGLSGKEAKEKMRSQIKIYAIPYLLTIVLLLIFGRPSGAVLVDPSAYEINLWSILPYALALGLALIGFNFVVSLSSGILGGVVIGLALGKFGLLEGFQTLGTGFNDNANMIWMFIFVSGVIGIASETGGINWIVEKLSHFIRSPRSAQLVLLTLGIIVTCCIGNNAIPNMTIGTIAADVSKKYKIDVRRTAALLTIAAGLTVSILPHSGIGLCMTGLIDSSGADASFIQCIPYNWFIWLAFAVTVITVFIPFSESHYRKKGSEIKETALKSELE